MNKFNEMIEQMHMPEEQYEQLKADLVRQTEVSRNTRPVWRRYAIAATLAICLLGTAVTAYAAVHSQWFQMFFGNGVQETDVMDELMAKVSTETVTAEDDYYKFTVLNHLYNEEQQMGLVVCSFHFLKEHHTHLDARDGENYVALKKNRVIDGQAFLTEITNKADRNLYFYITDKSGKEIGSQNSMYYAGELAEDGGYLIGIRYSFAVEKKIEQEPELIMSLMNAGDINKKLKVQLPQSGDIECVHFASEGKPGNTIAVSPLGMTLTISGDKAESSEITFNHDILRDMKLVREGQAMTAADFGEACEISTLKEQTKTAYTWYVQKEFANLVDVSEIDYIELDGEKYSK